MIAKCLIVVKHQKKVSTVEDIYRAVNHCEKIVNHCEVTIQIIKWIIVLDSRPLCQNNGTML